ncbi:hypothetical protein O6H91_10G054800 [Diphasiastrum complanatum]|uniref:Uncharacterized protein n=1 Tax=Diphasiastrum complanatum TaxID=34168 RepID=A0ACC2CHB3_DIPCM|nr:hypothetical protein O6H91_10G054800 [Diphasiastrum complanatum]
MLRCQRAALLRKLVYDVQGWRSPAFIQSRISQTFLASTDYVPVRAFTSWHFQTHWKESKKADTASYSGRTLVPLMAVGAASISFATSVVSIVSAKERPPIERIPKEVVLYQYESCPFCNKVKAFLDYHDIPYHVVEVNPIGKSELKWSEYKKVPVLVVDGEQLNDSTAIITTLDERINTDKAGLSGAATVKDEEDLWRRWVDEHLVHMLSPNIYRSPKEALEAFQYLTINGKFTAFERTTGKYFGATAMYMIGKRLKKRHNITDERQSLYEAVDTWVKALDNRPFLGGSKPNLADLAVFGVLKPIRQLQTGKDMIANTEIGDWYSRMEQAVGGSSRIRE